MTEPAMLIDRFGRRIRKLRVSLLDACSFRCFYCLPMNATFSPSSQWLSSEEIKKICTTLVSCGLEEIRVTGGEPTLRKDFREIILQLSTLPLKKLGLTSNGYKLAEELDFLKTTSCNNINISLDSLNPENFNRITRADKFNKVMNALLKAREMGFHVKINTLLLRGINDHEIPDFVRFSADNDIEVRFLELMKIGHIRFSQERLFLSASQALSIIRKKEILTANTVEKDSTSFNFTTSSGARIGFIASESRPFCQHCSRWRLSANGFLRACLMSEKGIQIRGLSPEEIIGQFAALFKMKPFSRLDEMPQNMNQVGG